MLHSEPGPAGLQDKFWLREGCAKVARRATFELPRFCQCALRSPNPGLGPEASRATLSCAKVARRLREGQVWSRHSMVVLRCTLKISRWLLTAVIYNGSSTSGGPGMHSKDDQMPLNGWCLRWILHIQGPPGGFAFIYNRTFRLPGGCFASTEGSLSLRESDGRLSYNHTFPSPWRLVYINSGSAPLRGQLTFEQPSACAIPWPLIFEHPSTLLSQNILRDPMVFFCLCCAIQRGACCTSISLR